jgi:hypothetical protein
MVVKEIETRPLLGVQAVPKNGVVPRSGPILYVFSICVNINILLTSAKSNQSSNEKAHPFQSKSKHLVCPPIRSCTSYSHNYWHISMTGSATMMPSCKKKPQGPQCALCGQPPTTHLTWHIVIEVLQATAYLQRCTRGIPHQIVKWPASNVVLAASMASSSRSRGLCDACSLWTLQAMHGQSAAGTQLAATHPVGPGW